jgi:amidophosphoribosyltransferase
MNSNVLDDKLHEECGVVGIYTESKESTSQLLYYGLYALQHRGQESAGIAVMDESEVQFHKAMGLVPEIFNAENLNALNGSIGIGHVRYSTTGESFVRNAQPLVVKYKHGSISLAHNGNLVNASTLREVLEDSGALFQTTIDTEVIATLIAKYHKNGIVKAVQKAMELVKGSYALVMTAEDKLIGVRDNFGIRPLCLGQLDDGYVLASESCALDAMGAEFIRDIEPGEIVVVDKNGIESIKSNKVCAKRSCVFELIYFARPDSTIDGTNVYVSRHEAGKILANESAVDADIVIAVPDSGIAAAIGYAEQSGIPYGVGLIKNKYIGRTFIQPDQALREQGVKIKLNVLKENVEGKRVIIIDDSIVRGTTSKHLVEILKKAGAKEVHMRISSPPVKYTCHFGIDTPYRKHLVGANKSVDEICEMIGADSLAFISIEGLRKATGEKDVFCKACFDGQYPMEVPREGMNGKDEE